MLYNSPFKPGVNEEVAVNVQKENFDEESLIEDPEEE